MLHSEILQGMARAFFASAWADACNEAGESSSLSGREIMEVMPQTIDPAAWHAARTLYFDMERVNVKGMGAILQTAESLANGDRECTPELFGHYCAMQSMGHGVGLHDSFGAEAYEAIRVPYCEFGSHSLSRDYF